MFIGCWRGPYSWTNITFMDVFIPQFFKVLDNNEDSIILPSSPFVLKVHTSPLERNHVVNKTETENITTPPKRHNSNASNPENLQVHKSRSSVKNNEPLTTCTVSSRINGNFPESIPIKSDTFGYACPFCVFIGILKKFSRFGNMSWSNARRKREAHFHWNFY